jgi:uncharacterized protein involved in exopolysaccharide biosynthesis
MASTVLRHRILILRLTVAGALFGGLLAVLMPRTYTSDFSFTPQEATPKGGISALAADLGVNVGGVASQSPAFYVDLLRTRKVLASLADQRISYKSDTGKVITTLSEILVGQRAKPPLRRLKAIKKLRDIVSSRVDVKTNVVRVSVKTESPSLSAQLASSLISEINRFNAETRNSQAAAERQFAEQRVSEARSALRAAEDRDQAFLLRNMVFSSSPELVFQKARYDREVALRASEYESLIAAYNRARLEEVRNIPVITLIEQPEKAVRHDSLGLLQKTLLSAVVGALIGLFVAFLRETLTRSNRAEREEFQEFMALRAAAASDFRHPARTLRLMIPIRKGGRHGQSGDPLRSA